ncbi:MAG: hypothetical protein AB8H80_18470 [Planctomycetota bacterium]
MPNLTHTALPTAILLAAASLTAQNFEVVPANYASADAGSFNWVAGASQDVRQQTLIGASHLGNLVGKAVTALELRRSSKDLTFAGGSCNMTVTLSISPNAAVACSSTLANNVGTFQQQVFNGTVTFPTSPANSASDVGWTANNTVRIPFTTPFAYTGGTLCIDIVGTTIPGQEAEWWMADARCEDIPGVVNDLGGGGGSYGGPSKKWSFVTPRSLVPGGYVHMEARGTPYGLAIAALGPRSATGTPLSLLGFNAPAGCELHLNSLELLFPRVFAPDPHPALVHRGGVATADVLIPAIPQALGFTMTTQWFDWTEVATSNAIEWTMAAAIPTLDMSLVEATPGEATGHVTNFIAHVMRFEHQ